VQRKPSWRCVRHGPADPAHTSSSRGTHHPGTRGTAQEAERWLEADAAKFDQFLRDNDSAAVAAIRAAEEATRRKQDRATDIKRLQAELMAVGSEVTKQEDAIAELRSYRLFLDSVAPQVRWPTLPLSAHLPPPRSPPPPFPGPRKRHDRPP
jgi:hypothetical protein